MITEQRVLECPGCRAPSVALIARPTIDVLEVIGFDCPRTSDAAHGPVEHQMLRTRLGLDQVQRRAVEAIRSAAAV